MKDYSKLDWNKINIKARSDTPGFTILRDSILAGLGVIITVLAPIVMFLTLWHLAWFMLSSLGIVMYSLLVGGIPTIPLSFSAIFIGKVVSPLLAYNILPSIIGSLSIVGIFATFGAYLAEERERKLCTNLINVIQSDNSPNLKRVYAFMQDNQDKLSFQLLQKPEILKEIISKGNIDLIKLVFSEPYSNNNIKAYYDMIQQILIEPMNLDKLEVAKAIIISTLNSSISENRSETKNFIRSVLSMPNSDKLIEYMNVEENQIFSKVLTESKSQILLNEISKKKDEQHQKTEQNDIEVLPRQSPVLTTSDKRSNPINKDQPLSY